MLRLRRKPLEAQENGHDAPATSTTALLVDEAPDEDPCIPEESFRDVGRSLPRRLFHWGPIIAIVLIVQIGFTATFFTLQWWPILSLDGVLHMVVFLFWNYSTLINLSRAAFIGGGFVPKGWRPANPEHEKFLQWCHVCESFKVPRSHHCSKCGRCVMKMDHHCPWINNCVGHRNHAFFVRFLASAVVGCLHAVFIIGFSLYHAVHREWYIRYGTGLKPNVTLTWYSLFAAILAFTLGAGVAIAVGLLLFYQIKYIIANKTGVEEYIVMKAERRREEEELEPFVYPYSLGWRRNVVEVLGTWSGSPRGNGVWWPLLHGHSQFEFSEEQLAQKRNKRAHSRGVRITRPFGGGCCGALRERGLRSFFCQPWNEDSRVAVSPGEIWLVTRGAKYWVYGIRVRPVEDASDSAFDPVLIEGRPFVPVEPAEKGWMPRDSFQLIPRDSDSSEE